MVKKIFAMLVLGVAPLKGFCEETQAFTWGRLLTLESLSNLHGGLATGTRNLANLDLTLSVDTQSANWWSQGKLFVYVLGNYGKPPSALSGELQTLSNIEADNNLTLYEFWYEHSFADDTVKLLFGLHDYNSTFYSLESASLFNLSSTGIGPEVAQVSPSIFPVTATTIHLTLSHGDQYFLLAVYDGVPGDPAHQRGTHIKFAEDDGLFIASEWGFAREQEYKIAVGGWRHTAKVESPIDGSLGDFNHGLYFLGEKYLGEHFAAFVQYGRADKHKNQLQEYAGSGAVYKNAFVEGDNLGVAYARAKNSTDFLAFNPDFYSAEEVVELSYFQPVMEKLNIQYSLYSVVHPSMAPDIDNSVAAGLRLYLEF
jgi:porin